jgi:flagellar biosynthesis/type III secretory pathway protein FliH
MLFNVAHKSRQESYERGYDEGERLGRMNGAVEQAAASNARWSAIVDGLHQDAKMADKVTRTTKAQEIAIAASRKGFDEGYDAGYKEAETKWIKAYAGQAAATGQFLN